MQIDYAREMSFIALQAQAGSGEALLGIVRAVTDPDNEDAEFALIVRSDLKGQGLGGLLLRKMERYLRLQGTQRMVCDVLGENMAMRRLARAHGMLAAPHQPGDDAMHFALALQADAPGTDAPTAARRGPSAGGPSPGGPSPGG